MECSDHAEVMWEASKENVQPLRSGRNLTYLKAALKPSEEDIQMLMKERRRFEEEILAGENSTDPLNAWDRYLKWIQQHLAAGENTKTYEQLLHKYIKKFRNMAQYKNDPRYVSAWVSLAQLQDNARNIYRYMMSEGIGTNYAPLYVAWAEEYEKYGKYKSADDVFNLAEKNSAEPKDYLQSMRNAFQMRTARASMKQMEEKQHANEAESMAQNSNVRKALGSLTGRGTKKVVGTTRTGRALAAQAPLVQTRQLQAPQTQKNTKLVIYEDTKDDQAEITSGSWTQMPDKKRAAKENLINDPKMWKGEKVKQKARSTALTVKVPAATSSTSFSIYKEETPENSAIGPDLCPSSTRKVCPNVEKILTDRKMNPYEESDFHKKLRESYGDKDSNVIRMYPVDKVYSVMGAFSPEEIMAAHWRKRKREQEEKAKIQRELEEKRLKEEEARREKEQLEEKLIRREEQLKKLIAMVEEKDLMDSDEPMDVNAEMTVKVNSAWSKMIQRQNLEKQKHEEPAHKQETVEPMDDHDEVRELPLPSIDESDARNHSHASLSNSLNRSKLAQPSPTIFTKEALGELNDMFAMPLMHAGAGPSAQGHSLYVGGASEVSLMALAEPPKDEKPKFAIYCDEEEPPEKPCKFDIFGEHDRSDDSENIPTPDYVTPPKRKNLSGILQPAVGFELADPDADSQEDEDENMVEVGVKPLDELEPAPTFLNDLTIAAGQNMVGRPSLAAKHLQEMPVADFHGQPHPSVSSMTAATEKFDDSIQINFASGSRISAESTTYWQGGGMQKVARVSDAPDERGATQDENATPADCTEGSSEQPQKKKLSPILEASDEFEKSVQSRTRLISSESDGQSSVAVTTTNGKSFLHPPTVSRKPLGDFSAITYDPLKVSTAPTTFDIDPDISTLGGVSKLHSLIDVGNVTRCSPVDLHMHNNTSLNLIKLDTTARAEDGLCDQLSTSLHIADARDKSHILASLPASADITCTGGLTVVGDPWNEKLLHDLMPLCPAENLIHDDGKAPLARKGSAITLGDASFCLVDLIGKGGFAKVYKATPESNRNAVVAIKIQSPPCVWESYILSEARRRSGGLAASLLRIHFTRVYPEASFIVSEFLPHGTLLDFVKESALHGRVIDHVPLAAKVMQIVHHLHQIGIIHADVKPDNFMVVAPRDSAVHVGGALSPVLKLIDFGRAIDMRAFPDGTAFNKSCGTSGFVCTQMHQEEPWNYHIDFHGVAGTVHVVLFNCYMTVVKRKDGAWGITKSLPRGNRPLWSSFFQSLLNVPTPTKDRPTGVSPLPELLSQFTSSTL